MRIRLAPTRTAGRVLLVGLLGATLISGPRPVLSQGTLSALETDVDQLYTLDTANPVVGGTVSDLEHVKAIEPLDGTEQNRVIEKNPNFARTSGRQQPLSIQLGLRWLF